MMQRDPPYRLLVVEDDPDTGEELAELLESHGVIARVARSADQARALVSSFRPDVALIDLHLGRCSGADLAAEWIAAGAALRIILLSGRTLTPAEARAFSGAIPPLLPKPLDLVALVNLVRAAG